LVKNNDLSSESLSTAFGRWFDERGRGIIQDGERVRLAICPGNVKKFIRFYEELDTQSTSLSRSRGPLIVS
jgi:hypothetical protein